MTNLLNISVFSYRHTVSFMHTSHMPAQRLHPFEGFATIIAHKVFPFSVYRLVSVQSARRDKTLPAYLTSVRPLPCVCPDVSCEMGTVTETLLTHRAAIGFLFALLAVVVVVRMEGQSGVMQAVFQARRRGDEVFNV